MRWCMTINHKGHLEISGVDLAQLSAGSSTPIYVIDEAVLRSNMRQYVQGLQEMYSAPSEVYYASKALMTMAMCKIAESEGLCIDVSSGGELYTAIQADFPMDKVIMHGNNKLIEELELAVKNGVGRIVIDNFEEITLLNEISQKHEHRMSVLIRVKPGVEAQTHHFMVTGTDESKFGFNLNEAISAIQAIQKTSHLEFKGIHFHIGSQISNTSVYEKSIGIMVALIQEIGGVEELNAGGGLGISYTGPALTIREFLYAICKKITHEFTKRRLPLPKLMVEPGRSIVGSAGLTLYKIGSIKQLPSGLTCAAVNGGMSDNIRPALYTAKYDAVMANRMNDLATCTTRIVGKCCESGDILISEILLPEPRRGDVLALLSTGAYCYSMASHYNRLPIPGIALISDGTVDWIVRPQTYEDLTLYDCVPERLKKDGKALSRILS
jgi:diaminopimelate decarboxylase